MTIEWGQIDLSRVCYHLNRSFGQSDYDAYPHLWRALLAASSEIPGRDEHRRCKHLLSALPENDLREIVGNVNVDALLALEEPLGHRSSSELERAEIERRRVKEKVKEALRLLRSRREKDPGGAVEPLYDLLAQVRHTIIHEHKSPWDERDQQILHLARPLLVQITDAIVAKAEESRL